MGTMGPTGHRRQQITRHLVRSGSMQILDEDGLAKENLGEHASHFHISIQQAAREVTCLSFDISGLEEALPVGAALRVDDFGDCRAPYDCLWVEGIDWGTVVVRSSPPSDDLSICVLMAISGRAVVVGGSLCEIKPDGSVGRVSVHHFSNREAIRKIATGAVFVTLLALGHINAKTAEIHFRGAILKDRVPAPPHVPLKLSSMPVVKLKPGVSIIRESGKGQGEKTGCECRYHPVRGHLMKTASGKVVWRRGFWRGNPDLGTIRPNYEVQ